MGTTLTLGTSTVGVRRSTKSKSITRFLPAVGRVVIGLPYFIGGLIGLLQPQPLAPMASGAAAFASALINSGYMMPLISVTQLVVGALLLSNRFVPLALALIAPFTVNSMAFHTILEHTGLPFATFFAVIEIALVRAYWPAYRPMLVARMVRSNV